MGWVVDLDGVVWLADEPIPGAAAAIERLRGHGRRLAFVTNNSYGTRADVAAKLARHGVDAGDDVVTSAMAAATLLRPGESVLVCGGPGVVEAIGARGAEPVLDGTAVDAVVVGYNPEFDYDLMRRASVAVRRGARLVATNDDATYPTPEGPIPGAGSILASIVVASGTDPVIAGKPFGPMADLVRDHLGEVDLVVGDRPDTDGRFATALKARFGLVLTGVTTRGDLPVEPAPDAVAASLAELVDQELARRP